MIYITNYFTKANDNYYLHSSSTQIENSNITQEATEVASLSDEYSAVSDITPKTNEEELINQQEKSENCTNEVIAIASDIEILNVSDKKNKTKGKRLEKFTIWKAKQTKQSVQSTSSEIMVQNLPSVSKLDSPSNSSSTVLEEEENFIRNKKKKALLNKLAKKKIVKV